MSLLNLTDGGSEGSGLTPESSATRSKAIKEALSKRSPEAVALQQENARRALAGRSNEERAADTRRRMFVAEKKYNIIGKRHGRLVVVGRVVYEGKKKNGKNVVKWICTCDCGNSVTAYGTDLKSGKHKSCGCLKKEIATARINRWVSNTTPAERSAAAKNASRTLSAERRNALQKEKMAARSPEERRAIASKGWETRRLKGKANGS